MALPLIFRGLFLSTPSKIHGLQKGNHLRMSEILSYLLFPLAKLIYRNTPSKLRAALANGDKTLTALEVTIALYAISLRYLPAGEILDRMELPKPWQSITDPWDLLIILSVLVVVHHAGGKAIMNLKFLLQATIEKIGEDYRREEREENSKAVESWLEEQLRTGKITINEEVELPEFVGNGKNKPCPGENGKKEE